MDLFTLIVLFIAVILVIILQIYWQIIHFVDSVMKKTTSDYKIRFLPKPKYSPF